MRMGNVSHVLVGIYKVVFDRQRNFVMEEAKDKYMTARYYLPSESNLYPFAEPCLNTNARP